jgi:hypothetical protein
MSNLRLELLIKMLVKSPVREIGEIGVIREVREIGEGRKAT